MRGWRLHDGPPSVAGFDQPARAHGLIAEPGHVCGQTKARPRYFVRVRWWHGTLRCCAGAQLLTSNDPHFQGLRCFFFIFRGDRGARSPGATRDLRAGARLCCVYSRIKMTTRGEKVEQLLEMGFPKDRAELALTRANDDMEQVRVPTASCASAVQGAGRSPHEKATYTP